MKNNICLIASFVSAITTVYTNSSFINPVIGTTEGSFLSIAELRGYYILDCAKTMSLFNKDSEEYKHLFDSIYSTLTKYDIHEISIDVSDETKRTACSYLVANPSFNDISLLSLLVTKFKSNFLLLDDSGKSALEYAFCTGSLEALCYLLQAKKTLKSESIYDNEISESKFIENIVLHDTERIIVILENNTNFLQNYKIMNRLIDHYKDCDDEKIEKEFPNIAKAYFSNNDVYETRDSNILSILYDISLKLASSINFKKIADILFSYAGSINQQNDKKETPAHIFVKNAALMSGHFFEILAVFQKHGADFTNIKDVAKKTVYDYIVNQALGFLFKEEGVKEVSKLVLYYYLKSHGIIF